MAVLATAIASLGQPLCCITTSGCCAVARADEAPSCCCGTNDRDRDDVKVVCSCRHHPPRLATWDADDDDMPVAGSFVVELTAAQFVPAPVFVTGFIRGRVPPAPAVRYAGTFPLIV